MFHLNLNFKTNEKILFKSNILLHQMFIVSILRLFAFISFSEEMQFLMPQATETEE